MGHSKSAMTRHYAHLLPDSFTKNDESSECGFAAKSVNGLGSKTGSNETQRVEQGPVRTTEPSEMSVGMVGGAGRVRTAASQFCSLPEGSTTDEDQQRPAETNNQ